MSAEQLRRSPTRWVLLITCLCAQRYGANNPRPWLNRKDVIKTMPLPYQKLILQETLNQQNVELTNDVPAQLNSLIPDIIEFLVNGAIDGFLGQVPGVSRILGPIIKGGIGWLKNKFGNRKVYIPNMPPVIRCPASMTLIADKGSTSKIVSWTEPLGYDAEDGTLYNVRRRGKPPGSKFSGEEIIQYEVSDSKGRTDFCSFSITISIIKCAPIDLMSHRINTCRGPTRYGTECNFSCVKGYTLVGQQKLTCTQDGVYNFQGPTCNIKTCKAPELPRGGHNWTCSNSYNYDSTCTINCAEGFRNVRTFDRAPWEQANIRCKENGNWTRLPICKVFASKVLNFLCRDVGPDSTTCTWFPPVHVGGQLLGYQIDYQEVSKSETLSVLIKNERTVSFTLANLKPDTDYVISIYAMSQKGRGVKTPLNIRTKPPVPASKVLNFLCRDVGPDSASCTWFPPAHDSGQLLGYQIDYQEVSKSNTLTVVITNERTVSFTLANLKPDTDYLISIYAMNQKGRGVKTPLDIRTKPPAQ